jgi:tyrosyl-tRNA synthetase
MSISDELMKRYYTLLLGEELAAESHPMEAKKQLAWKLTARYHDSSAADAARANWEATFSKKNYTEADLPIFTPGTDIRAANLCKEAYQTCFAAAKSGSQIRQLIQQGSIQLNGEKITDPNAELMLSPGDILKLDKKCIVKIG